MKNAMKKTVSLMLAIMLLVCAVPFGALAAEVETTGEVVVDKFASVQAQSADLEAQAAGEDVFAKENITPAVVTIIDKNGNFLKDSVSVNFTDFANDNKQISVYTLVSLALGDWKWNENYEYLQAKVRRTGTAANSTPVDIAYSDALNGGDELHVQLRAYQPIGVKIVDANKKVLADTTVSSVEWDDKNTNNGVVSVGTLMSVALNTWDWNKTYTVTSVQSAKNGTVSYSTGIADGDSITVTVTEVTGPAGGITGSTGGTPVVDSDNTNKFPYNVYLNIYKDTQVGSPNKTINITNGIALDGVVSLDEVKTVVMDYYGAKDSYGIAFDGLYLAEGTWVVNYVTDTQKYGSFVSVNELRKERTVYINVMITNAYEKGTSSSTTYVADSSNPKTGDAIYGVMAIMALSGTALATMFFLNKKRIAR